MDDFMIDVAPVRRWRSAMRALERRDLPSPRAVRLRIEEGGEDLVCAVVGYLEGQLCAALDTALDELDAVALGRALLAEELLVILTGSDDLEGVRAWLRAPRAPGVPPEKRSGERWE